jgi:CDP-glucose 4,6-dehydratase
LNPAFWAGRRVLVTGDTGFKGAWLALWLARMGAEVRGFALAPATEPSLFTTARVTDVVEHVTGDVRDAAAVATAVADREIVLHLAAQSLVRRSYREPIETFGTNVMGTANVLEAVRNAPGVRAAVVVTTDKVYENREWAWGYRENDTLGGHDPYAASKACTELAASAWRRSFFATRPIIATARAGNVIGGGDWSEDRLVPDLARAAIARAPAVLRNPRAVRPWQHVLDPLAGYLLLAERLAGGDTTVADAWNFGPADADAIPTGALADRFCAGWGAGASWRHDGAPQPHESGVLRLDCAKARLALGWRPRLPLDTGLDWTCSWYRDVAGGRDARDATLEQIDRYAALLAAPDSA